MFERMEWRFFLTGIRVAAVGGDVENCARCFIAENEDQNSYQAEEKFIHAAMFRLQVILVFADWQINPMVHAKTLRPGKFSANYRDESQTITRAILLSFTRHRFDLRLLHQPKTYQEFTAADDPASAGIAYADI